MKRIIGLFLCILMLLAGVLTVSAETTENINVADNLESQGFMLISENAGYQFYVNIETAVIKIKNLKNGYIWSTNPDSEFISGISKTAQIQLNSQLKISFLDESRNYVTATSYDSCILEDSYSMETVEKDGAVIGVKTIYDFNTASQCIKIPVKVILQDDGISAEICFNEIEEYGTSKLCQVELFPFFSAAVGSEAGYLFVPDGNGAIIDFKDRYRNADDYEKPVYGADSAVNINLKSVDASAGIKMPVFGMKKGSFAFFAEISKADAMARICASSADDRYSASSVWASFCYRECDETGIIDGDNLIRTVRMADENPTSVNPVVKYRFLNGDEANYLGMAKLYREILIEKYALSPLSTQESKIIPFLQVYGKTYRKSSFFGIPYNKAVNATTFNDVENMYNALIGEGIEDFSIALYGFSKGGFNNNYIKKQKFDSGLGGNKGFNSLVETAQNADIYAVYDLNRDYSAADNFFKGKKYIQSLNSLTIVREKGALSTGASANLQKWLLLNSQQLLKNANKLLKSLQNPEKYGVLYQNMGSEIYNDFNKSHSADRQQLIDTYSEILKNTEKTAKNVASDGANIYMLSGTNFLTEVPLSSSNYEIFSQDVPFYTTVLQGYVKMASVPLNNTENIDAAVMLCAEYGVMPTYRITQCSSDELKDTNLNFLYNSKFEDWKEIIVKHYKCISDN